MNQTLNQYPHQWRAFTGITLLSFGSYLDYTIVNVALPTIQQQLNANLATSQWMMNIYFLALCVLATIMGRCGDLYGRRRLFYIGAGIFTLASILAGIATSIQWLIIGRLLQGVGAAIVFPLGPSLLPSSFPEKDRSKAIAWLGSFGGIALALGPVLGGLIVEYSGWRWIFFINVPLALVGFLFCHGIIAESKIEEKQKKLDWIGMLLLTIAISGIVLGLIHSQEYGWKNIYTLIYLITGAIASIALVIVENGIENPLIEFKDFTNLLFSAGIALVLLAGTMSAVALFFDPLYLQILRHQSPQLSGLILFIIPVAVFGIAFLVDKMINKFGLINSILFGLILGIIASIFHLFFNQTTSLYFILLTFFILGSMWALGNTIPIIAAQTAVGNDRASVATGTVVTMFNLGGSLGLSIAVVVFHGISTLSLQSISQKLNGSQLNLLKKLITNPATSLQIDLDNLTYNIFNYSFIHGFAGVIWFLLIFASLIFLVVFCWKIFKEH